GSNTDSTLTPTRTYCERGTNGVHSLARLNQQAPQQRNLSRPRIPAIRSTPMSVAALRIVEGSSMDKSKALSAALSQIERQFGKGSVMRLGKNDRSMDVETVSSGSLGL